jgi:hypothetical protein
MDILNKCLVFEILYLFKPDSNLSPFSAIYQKSLVPYNLYMKWETKWPNAAKDLGPML